MGRRQEAAEYFFHFARPGKTLFILTQRYGNDGYAGWYRILELLTSTAGHALDVRGEEDWQYVVAYMGVEEDVARGILELVAKLGTIDRELYTKGWIWCQGLVDNLGTLYTNRRRAPPQKPCL